MTLLSEIKGWSPIIHSLARQEGIGLITAAVYGAVWRYCQMDNRTCNASLETIADDLGIDKATVLRHVKKLCKKGYLKDETPGLRNVPHTYSDTGKVKISSSIEAKTVAHSNTSRPKTVAHSNTSRPKTVAHSNTFDQTVAHSNATVAHSNATVAESQLNRVFKKDSKKGGEEPAPDFETLAKKALTIYSEIANLKLDTTQGRAVTAIIDPGFDLGRWQRACYTTKLAGVRPENIQCRIDTYRAGGDYQVMISQRRNGDVPGPAPPPKLSADQMSAYKARLEADQAEADETAARVNGLMSDIRASGVDITKQTRNAGR